MRTLVVVFVAMRYLLAVTAITVLVLSGCDDNRQNMSVVPDRQGHAYGAEGIVQPSSTGPVAGQGEMYYTMEANDTLHGVAKKFNVDLAWLIRRNDIQDESKVKPGKQLIVPRMQTAAPAPVPTPAPTPAPHKAHKTVSAEP